MQLKDRERILREALAPSKLAKGQKPEDAVVPLLDEDGGCECPQCGNVCVTPVHNNIWTGVDEKMVLVPNKCNHCPHCGVLHFITPDLALDHNHFWFPEDKRYQRK